MAKITEVAGGVDLNDLTINKVLSTYSAGDGTISIRAFMNIVVDRFVKLREELLQRENILLQTLKENGFKYKVKRVFLEYDYVGEMQINFVTRFGKLYNITVDDETISIKNYYLECCDSISENHKDDEEFVLKLYDCVKPYLFDCIHFFQSLSKKDKMFSSCFFFNDDGFRGKYNLIRLKECDVFSFSFTFLEKYIDINFECVTQMYKSIFGYKTFSYVTARNERLKGIVAGKYQKDILDNLYLPRNVVIDNVQSAWE